MLSLKEKKNQNAVLGLASICLQLAQMQLQHFACSRWRFCWRTYPFGTWVQPWAGLAIWHFVSCFQAIAPLSIIIGLQASSVCTAARNLEHFADPILNS